MRVLIAGTGSIGCTIGASLLKSGTEVRFLAKGKNLKTFSENNLLTTGETGEYSFKLNITGDIKSLTSPDLVILAVKSKDIIKAARDIIPLLHKGTIVLTIQDGVDNESVLKPLLGEHLVGGLTYSCSDLNEATLNVFRLREIIIGEVGKAKSERITDLAAYLNSVGVKTSITDDLLTEKWVKLEWNCAFNAISAVEKMTVKEILSNSETRARAVKLMIETARTGKAEGIRFPDNQVNFFLKESFEMDFKTTMLLDLEKGREPEYETINGFVIRTAEKHKLRVPENLKIYSQLKLIMNDKL